MTIEDEPPSSALIPTDTTSDDYQDKLKFLRYIQGDNKGQFLSKENKDFLLRTFNDYKKGVNIFDNALLAEEIYKLFDSLGIQNAKDVVNIYNFSSSLASTNNNELFNNPKFSADSQEKERFRKPKILSNSLDSLSLFKIYNKINDEVNNIKKLDEIESKAKYYKLNHDNLLNKQKNRCADHSRSVIEHYNNALKLNE
jgi:hypothetical protein